MLYQIFCKMCILCRWDYGSGTVIIYDSGSATAKSYGSYGSGSEILSTTGPI